MDSPTQKGNEAPLPKSPAASTCLSESAVTTIEDAVVIAGYLRLYAVKGKKIRKKFRQRFFLLYADSPHKPRRLRYYPDQKAYIVNAAPLGELLLEDSTKLQHVVITSDSSVQAFQVIGPSGQLVLGSENDDFCLQWMDKIDAVLHGSLVPHMSSTPVKQHPGLPGSAVSSLQGTPLHRHYSASTPPSLPPRRQFAVDEGDTPQPHTDPHATVFKVTLIATDDSSRLNLSAQTAWISVYPMTVVLDCGIQRIVWPITGLRRYSRTPSLSQFHIEAGTRCGPPQGKYTFATPDFQAIYDLVRSYAIDIANAATHGPPAHGAVLQNPFYETLPLKKKEYDYPLEGDLPDADSRRSSLPHQYSHLFGAESDPLDNSSSGLYHELGNVVLSESVMGSPPKAVCDTEKASGQYNTLSGEVRPPTMGSADDQPGQYSPVLLGKPGAGMPSRVAKDDESGLYDSVTAPTLGTIVRRKVLDRTPSGDFSEKPLQVGGVVGGLRSSGSTGGKKSQYDEVYLDIMGSDDEVEDDPTYDNAHYTA